MPHRIACIVVLVVLSACDLKAQQADPAAVTPLTIGETLKISSEVLGETRPIQIYLPPSYATDEQRYPVLYVLDGEMAFLHTASAVQFLAQLGQVPEMIVVAISNTNRMHDMPIPDGYGRGGEDQFLAFLADELIPHVDREYRTYPLRILSGHSQGGLFAVYAMITRPDAFQWYLVMDAPLFGSVDHLKSDVLRLVQQSGYRGRLVTVERTLGWHADWEELANTETSNFRAYRIEVARETETHETMTYEGTYEALRLLFADYAPDDLTTKNLETLEAEYAALSAQYGYSIPIARRLILRNIDDLLFQARAEEAEALLGYYTARYGTSSTTDEYAKRLDEVQQQGPLDETVDDILAYPRPAPDAMRPYLGTWIGRLYAEDGRGVSVQLTVTFEVEDGQVVGHTTQTYPNGSPRQLENVMIRLLKDGTLEWGYMNQMRPRGVLVTSGRLTAPDTFEGTQEMRGVRMQFPPGFTSSTWLVELTRRADS